MSVVPRRGTLQGVSTHFCERNTSLENFPVTFPPFVIISHLNQSRNLSNQPTEIPQFPDGLQRSLSYFVFTLFIHLLKKRRNKCLLI